MNPSLVTIRTVAFALMILVGLGIVLQKQEVLSDPAYGLLAVEQYLLSHSPSIIHVSSPSQADINTDISSRITWWAPGYQAFPYLFRLLGFNPAMAIKATVLFAFLVGVSGWTVYFLMILGRSRPAWLCVIALLLFRYTHVAGSLYDGGELLLYAFFPWVLVLNLRCMEQSRQQSPALVQTLLAGFACLMLFLLKFSAAIYIVALAAIWLFRTIRQMSETRRIPAGSLAWLAGFTLAALVILGMGFPGGNTPATAAAGLQFAAFWHFFSLPLAIGDLQPLLNWLVNHSSLPAGSRYQDYLLAPLLFVGTCVILFRPAQDEFRKNEHFRILLPMVFIASLVLVLLGMNNGAISLEARFQRSGALILFPFVVKWLLAMARSPVVTVRIYAIFTALVLLVIPAVYGASTLGFKAMLRRTDPAYAIGPDGLVRHGLKTDPYHFYGWLQESFADRGVVIMLPAPDFAIPLAADRVILTQADFEDISVLRTRIFRGVPEQGVLLVALPAFVANGKLAALKSSFPDVTQWEQIRPPFASELVYWLGK